MKSIEEQTRIASFEYVDQAADPDDAYDASHIGFIAGGGGIPEKI